MTPEPMNPKILRLFPGIGLQSCPALLLVFAFTAFFEAKATDPQNTVVATVNVGSLPGYLVCSPDDKFVYVTISGGIAVINAETNKLSTNFSLPGSQTFVAISKDGQTLYASDIANTGNGIQVISIANQSVTTLVPFEYPTRLALSPDGTQLWVSNSTNDTQGGIYVIDTSTNQVTAGPIQVSNSKPGLHRLYTGWNQCLCHLQHGRHHHSLSFGADRYLHPSRIECRCGRENPALQ